MDVEYGRWLEEHNKQIDELRAAISARATDGDLHAIVENIMAHVDEIFRLKSVATKANAFHVLAGAWTTPVERCFLWLSGFRPSELPKVSTEALTMRSSSKLLKHLCFTLEHFPFVGSFLRHNASAFCRSYLRVS